MFIHERGIERRIDAHIDSALSAHRRLHFKSAAVAVTTLFRYAGASLPDEYLACLWHARLSITTHAGMMAARHCEVRLADYHGELNAAYR